MPEINYLAVLVAAIAAMALGALWYSKLLFGKKWQELVGKTDEELKKGAGKAIGGTAVAWLIISYVLAHFIDYTSATTWDAGLVTALWIGLGFMAMSQLIITLYEDRKMSLFAISVGYQVLAVAIMAIIHALWV
jgi:hypothetical protein